MVFFALQPGEMGAASMRVFSTYGLADFVGAIFLAFDGLRSCFYMVRA